MMLYKEERSFVLAFGAGSNWTFITLSINIQTTKMSSTQGKGLNVIEFVDRTLSSYNVKILDDIMNYI